MRTLLEYKNLPKIGFNSLQPEFAVQEVKASMRIHDTITLTLFSIFQIVAGVRHAREIALQKGVFGLAQVGLNLVDLLGVSSKLFELGLTPRLGQSDEVVEIEVLRGDVEIMLALLKLRMSHCEKQRDNREPGFNPDTYIGQKLLLIELREWLLLETVNVPTPASREEKVDSLDS